MARNSNNLEGSLFSGQHTKMERSSSFREGLESRAAGSSRNTQHTTEIPPLTQYLNFEPIPLREQQQKSKAAELRRVLGTGLDEHGFGSAQSKTAPAINPEELKRFKATLLESSSKAGENVKYFQDAITKVDKYKNVVAKRRQRSAGDIPGDKPGGSNLSKIGGSHSNNPGHQVLAGEHLGQRQDDRPKNLIPNKRARSSLGESRSEGRGLNSMRSTPTNSEKEKNFFEKEKNSTSRLAGSEGPTPSEEKPRGLTPGADGWEKKLKRKRSVGSMVNRSNDGAHADSKQAASPRPNINAERRSNDNGLGFRSGLSSGTTGGNKTDVSSQQSSGNGTRSSVKTDSDSNPSDRKEQRSSALEKDRSVPKGNKVSSREESQGGALNPLAKTKASRAPRTNSFVVMNSSPGFPRLSSPSTDGWEPPTSNKIQNSTSPVPSASNTPVANNRKRPLPSGPPSPSPPVAQWVGTRPQKIQRTRRANVVSPVSNFDEIQTPNDGSVPSPSASIQNNAISSTMLQQKTRGDVATSSPAGLSEGEESKVKGVENGEMVDNKASVSTNKKANRVLLKEELGDGVRRQGRSGRGGAPGQGRSLPPLPKEKIDGNDTKPPKTGRPTSDRNDSRIGRPPLKKAVDRRSHGRPGQSSHIVPSDLTGDLDDDKEELMSAINAARIACFDACTGPFWKKMEPVFSSVPDDLTFLKNQIAFVEALDRSASDVLVNSEENDPSQLLLSSHKSSTAGSTGTTTTDDWLEQSVPLSQMLLSAFISTDGSEQLLDSSTCTANGDSDYYPYEKVDKGQCNGFLDGSLLNSHCQNGPYSQSIAQSHEMVLNSARPPLYECQYEDMTLDDRILLELHSIGIYPDSRTELDDGEGVIDMSASELQKELAEKVKEKKDIMQILEKAFHDAKKYEERHIEQLAMDKLVERACKKILGGRGGSSHKGGASKLSKQLAQAFGKRTLTKCHEFEETGRSCFSHDPALRDTLFAALQRPDFKQPDGISERRKLDRGPSDLLEQAQAKTDQISNRGKKREVLLEEVSRGTPSAFGPKWKKSDQSKDGSGKNSSPSAKGSRGERKNKTKPKQKMGHLSSSQNGVDKVTSTDLGHLDVGCGSGNKPGQHKSELPGPTSDMNDMFAGLPIPFDDLDAVAGDANDLGSWLNVDDESLQDTDLVGLQIPMDDLADLTFT